MGSGSGFSRRPRSGLGPVYTGRQKCAAISKDIDAIIKQPPFPFKIFDFERKPFVILIQFKGL